MKTELPAGQSAARADDTALRDEALPASLTLIVGLGNPGSEYASHRHNVGFQIVEALADIHGLSFARHKKAKARVAKGQIGERPVLLAKPQTFMNLSGKTVLRLSREREIPPECILVVCDDLDLPLGRLRIRPQGGSGGHKGLQSIIELLGSQDFARLRVGIDRPAGSLDPAEYVLQPFVEEDKAIITETVERAVEAIESWLADGIVAAMDRFNRPPPGAADSARDEQSSTADSEEGRDDAGEPVLLPLSPVPLHLPSGSQENGT
jgi:PTH1 family peptidyl-tRNA hydrolase